MAVFKTHLRRSVSNLNKSCLSPLLRWVKEEVTGLDVRSERRRPHFPTSSPSAIHSHAAGREDCVWWGGFIAVVSQSECQGKSSLTFLTSSPHKGGARGNRGSNCNFMSISCSTNQGEQETCQPAEIFLLLA